MNRYYYYQIGKPEHRTWYKPIRDPAEERALQQQQAKVMEVSIEEAPWKWPFIYRNVQLIVIIIASSDDK